MFRPGQPRLGYVPIWLPLSAFALGALLLTAGVAVGVQYGRHRLLTSGLPVPTPGSSGLVRGLGWPELVAAFAALLVLAAISFVLFGAYQNYRAVTETFERVKSLMRNILESIPTGVLTLDAGGAVTSLNGPGERLLGLRASAIRGRPVSEALQSAPDLTAWVLGALAGDRLLQEHDFALTEEGSRRVTVRASASDLRDESDRDGMRVVVELKKDAVAEVVLNNLYKQTQMQTSFGVQLLAIVQNRPRTMNLKELLEEFLAFRKEVVTKRTLFLLRKAEGREHILLGLSIALDHIDAVIRLIRASKDPKEAKEGLVAKFGLSEIQAQAILDMRLQRLTGLEREKILQELKEVRAEIARLKKILGEESELLRVIGQEFREIRDAYGDARRSEIQRETKDLRLEDLIVDEEMVVTVSHTGYIKRNPISLYRTQRRGGRGKVGMGTKEEDFVSMLFIASMHTYVLFFSDQGKVYWLKVHELPEAGRASKGRAIVNLLSLSPGEEIASILPVREFTEGKFVMTATALGVIKKTDLMEYSRPRAGGIIAMGLNEGDRLIATALTTGRDEVSLSTRRGMSIRFHEEDVRPMGRAAVGVRGIDLEDGDVAVGMEILKPEGTLLSVTEHGYGKRSAVEEYRSQSRGGKGVIALKVTEKTGRVVGVSQVAETDEVMLVTDGGKIIRLGMGDLRVIGRNTQGGRLIGLAEKERVVSIARLAEKEE